MHPRQVANLQVLRAVAALLVVLFHLQPTLNAAFGQSLHVNFPAFGVDIFFVISGFVMFYSNRRLDRDAGQFLVERFFRIVPLYWLATLMIVACFMVGFRPVGLHLLNGRILLQSLLFVQSSFPDGRHDLILTVGWTLMYELFFYAAFALTFVFRSQVVSLLLLGLSFAMLIAGGKLFGPLPYAIDFYACPIIVEFLYGAALAILYDRLGQRAPSWLPALGVMLIVAAFAMMSGWEAMRLPVPNKHDARFLLFGVPGLLIVAGALAMEKGGWIMRQSFPLLLGAASYALYLFHPLILQIVIKGCAILLPRHGALAVAVAALLAVAICIFAAIGIHLAIERPLLRKAKALIAGMRMPGAKHAQA